MKPANRATRVSNVQTIAGVGNQVIFIGEVGSVCHHNAHAKGEGEECLPQSGQDCNAVDGGEINIQHVFQTMHLHREEYRNESSEQSACMNSRGIKSLDIFSIPAVPWLMI